MALRCGMTAVIGPEVAESANLLAARSLYVDSPVMKAGFNLPSVCMHQAMTASDVAEALGALGFAGGSSRRVYRPIAPPALSRRACRTALIQIKATGGHCLYMKPNPPTKGMSDGLEGHSGSP